MCNMYQIIEDLCERKGITVGKMCADLTISRGTLGDLNKGRTQKLSAGTMEKIAAYFGISIDYLLGKESNAQPQKQLSKAKQDFINEIMDWPDEQIKALTEAARAFKAMYQK